MVAGHALVVSDRLVVDQRSLGKVRSGDDNARRALSVGCADHVVRRGSGIEIWNGFDGNWRFRKQAEQFGQFSLHLRNVMAEVIENLLGRSWNVLGIGLQGGAK